MNLYHAIIQDLEIAGETSPYKADANEPDPRYKSYGVRMPAVKTIFKTHRKAIKALPNAEQIELSQQLIRSSYGEQQTIGFFILEKHVGYFSAETLPTLDNLARHIFGWSKIDSFALTIVRHVFDNCPDELLALIRHWNSDPDRWLRRLSVVVFTRKIAESGIYNDFALEMCQNLIFDDEDLVLKGVGWALKDVMRSDKERVLDYVYGLRQQGVSSVVTLYAIRDLKGQERTDFLARS